MAHCVYVYVQVFLDEVSKVKGFAVRFDHGTDVKTAAAAQSDAPNPASPKTEKLETIEQMQSMVYQAQQNHGFCIGTMVVDKEANGPEIWKLCSYDGDVVVLKLQDMGRDGGEKRVSVADLMAKWRRHKGVVTTLMPGWSPACTPMNSSVWRFECVKGAVLIAMKTVFAMLEPSHTHLDLFCNPAMARCKSTLQTGDLMLAPATMRIDRKDSPGAMCVGKFIVDAQPEPVFIAPQCQLPIGKDGQPNKNPWVAQFLQLRDAPKSKCTMQPKVFLQQVGDMEIRVPVLVNSKPLAIDDEVTWEKGNS